MATRLQSSGKLTFLRVNDVNDRFGDPAPSAAHPHGNQIDVEVVCMLDTEPGRAFGFRLRTDKNRFTHAGMLDILRDAFKNDFTVTIDFDIDADKSNGVIMRTTLTK